MDCGAGEQMSVGFFEESEGVKSSSRLFAAILLFLTGVVTFTICAYVLQLGKDASAAVIGALVGVVTALGAQGAVAIAKRNDGGNAN